MKKLTWALLSLMLFLGMGTAFAEGEGDVITVTLNPTPGAVSGNTSVEISAVVADGYTQNGAIQWGLAATQTAAQGMSWQDMEDYADGHKPVIKAGATWLKVRVLANSTTGGGTKTFEQCYEYTIAVGDLPTPSIHVITSGQPSNNVSLEDKIMIECPEDETCEGCEYWYTTDGSVPAKDGANATKYTKPITVEDVLVDGAEKVTIKAIAVDGDNKTSAVAVEEFVLAAPVELNLQFYDMEGSSSPYTGDTYGKYVELTPMIMGNQGPEYFMMYYTVDGETEPDGDAYDDQEDPTAGPIYAISYNGDDMPTVMFTENTTVFKALIQSQAGEQKINRTMTAIDVIDPEFEVENGVLKISNYYVEGEGEPKAYFDEIYYTTDGTVPNYTAGQTGKASKYNHQNGIALPAVGQTIKLIGFIETGAMALPAGSNMIEIARPAAPAIEPATGSTVDFGDKLTITCADDAMIYYTTNGEDPDPAAGNGKFYSEWQGATITATTIKAISFIYVGDDDILKSDVTTATYTMNPITATLSLVPVKDDTVGMNVGTGIEFSIDGWEEYPATVYYTVDGTTEPSKAAYEAQGANGAIKMLTVETMEYEAWGGTYTEIVRTDGHALAITFKEATQLKAIGYITLAGQDVVTPVLDKTLKIKSEAAPVFTLADGTELKIGDKLVIENPNPYPEAPELAEYPEHPGEEATEEELAAYDKAVEAWKEEEAVWSKEMEKYREAIADIPMTVIYYSFDGTEPTSAAYDLQREEDWSVFKTQEGQNVTVFFQKDEKGYYAYVPELLGYFSPADTLRLSGGVFSFTLKAMAVTTESEEGGEGDDPMPLSAKMIPGGDFAFMYGSDFAVANYRLSIAKPTFNPAGGEVSFGTKVEISCINDDAKIYYYCYVGDEEPEAIEYKEAIEITQSMKINAVAVLGDFKSEVAEATYTVIAKPAFSVKAGEVEKGTKVELSCATKEAKIYYTVDGSEPTAESAEYTTAIEINAAMTVKAIAIKGEAKSEVAEAAYKIKTANEGEELAGVSVYPNPSNGLFNIELPVSATIEVFMSNGMLYQRVKAAAGNATLNIERSGIYFLRITGEGRTTIKRLIVR